ncbi:MAG: Fic family protein [Endozoicomonas sp.]|uniref:Fic family protein n=1 Tax=Endozoicomonas sp. TaxID=1892382 RepID=UPI003D9BF11E
MKYQENVKLFLLSRLQNLVPAVIQDEETARLMFEALERDGHQCIQIQSAPAMYTEELLEYVLGEFDNFLLEAQTNEDIYKAIAWMLPRYMQIHPFPDANLRTAMLLANNALIRFGLPPLIMEDPNIVQLHDEETLLKELHGGSQNCLYLARENELHGYAFPERGSEEVTKNMGYLEPLLEALNSSDMQ